MKSSHFPRFTTTLLIMMAAVVLAAGCSKMPDGEHETHYKSGELKGVYMYKGGKLNGPVKTFYETGMKRTEATYVDGKLDGVAKKWTRSGKLAGEATFKMGEKIKEKTFDVVSVGGDAGGDW